MAHPKLSNIPLWNLLEEFFRFRTLLESEQFRAQLREAGAMPVHTPLYEWYGQADDLLSLIVQPSILGVESYVSAAVWLEYRGPLSPELNEMIHNPFRISPRAGTAMSFYHHLPALLSEDLSLRNREPELWERVEAFYRDVRNPLFHGMQFNKIEAAEVPDFLALIQGIYEWIGTWHAGDLEAAKRRFLVLRSGG